MAKRSASIVVCGAGMVGVAAAYHLAVRQGVSGVVLVDERAPLTLTSDKGTEAYRNWWPGPDDTMVRFMNRSIDLLEELAEQSDNCFQMNRRGYLFLTADPEQIPRMQQTAAEISALGAGELRIHPGADPYIPSPPATFRDLPGGADLLLDGALIRQLYPFLTEEVVAATHVRRCGWLDGKQLGGWMLEQFQAHGGELLRDRVAGVALTGGRVGGVRLQSGDDISTDTLVIAAGPFLRAAGAMLGIELPVFNELHGKIAFKDYLGLVPHDVPMMIWNDPLFLPWSEEERERLLANEESHWLLDRFPAGVHFRPRGEGENAQLLVIWTYDTRAQEAVWPPQFDPYYPEILLRGLSRMIPALSAYFGQGGQAYVDGGYYCKTRENRPFIGPLPVEGAFVVGALSGFGVMGSQAAGELLAAHVTGSELPDYAPLFLLERYEDPAYQRLIESCGATAGQL